MLDNLYELKRQLNSNNVIFSFCGPMSQKVVEGVGTTVKNALATDNVSPTVSMKVFGIFVEQVQNVIHYSEDKISNENMIDNELRLGIIMIGQCSENYFVAGGNKIKNIHVQKLDDMLQKIISMDKEELKDYYKQKRREENETTSKGGGLGFVEMARKSSKPMEYLITKIDNDYSFFSIKVIV